MNRLYKEGKGGRGTNENENGSSYVVPFFLLNFSFFEEKGLRGLEMREGGEKAFWLGEKGGKAWVIGVGGGGGKEEE